VKIAPLPPDEQQRLAELEATHLMFSPAEERFDRVTRLAAHLLDTPMALITLVDEKRQWFKSSVGVELTETPREVAFCAHAIADDDRLVVGDAKLDDRFADNPLVAGDPHIRAYVGEPLRCASGRVLGTLCVLDSKPRTFSKEELALLEDLSAIVESELRRPITQGAQGEYLRHSTPVTRANALDAATRCWNHDVMVELLLRQSDQAGSSGQTFAVALIGLERIRQVGTKLGDQARDQVLGETASAIRHAMRDADALGRYDEEQFIAILPEVDERAARAEAGRVVKSVASRTYQAGRIGVTVGATVGLALWREGATMVSLVEAADRALKQAQQTREHCAVAEPL
jgi:diguanylate cyclase (GGDEF)-like protein